MDSAPAETFKDRLVQELSFKGISNKEFAAEIGISINTLNMYLYRNSIPAADIAVKMAAFLNTTVEYLVSGQNGKRYPPHKNWKKTEIQNIVGNFSEKELSCFFEITKAFRQAVTDS